MMDIEEFERKVLPRAKRSRLEPFQAQIFELKTKGYANWQVCEWLAANDLKVSQEAVRKFIKSREGKTERVHAPLSGSSTQGQRVHPSTVTAHRVDKPAATPQDLTLKGDAESPNNDLELAGKSQAEQKRILRERRAQHFIKDDAASSNPLLKHLNKKD